MNADAAALATRLRAELTDLEQIVERAQKLLAKAVERDEDYYDDVTLICIASTLEQNAC